MHPFPARVPPVPSAATLPGAGGGHRRPAPGQKQTQRTLAPLPALLPHRFPRGDLGAPPYGGRHLAGSVRISPDRDPGRPPGRANALRRALQSADPLRGHGKSPRNAPAGKTPALAPGAAHPFLPREYSHTRVFPRGIRPATKEDLAHFAFPRPLAAYLERSAR